MTQCQGNRFTLGEIQLAELDFAQIHHGAQEGDPTESMQRVLVDGKLRAGVWEVTPGTFRTSKNGVHSMMFVVNGRATVTADDGQVAELYPGVAFVEPDGWSGTWAVHETLRKLYVIAPASEVEDDE